MCHVSHCKGRLLLIFYGMQFPYFLSLQKSRLGEQTIWCLSNVIKKIGLEYKQCCASAMWGAKPQR
jgi:hypothetical protein